MFHPSNLIASMADKSHFFFFFYRTGNALISSVWGKCELRTTFICIIMISIVTSKDTSEKHGCQATVELYQQPVSFIFPNHLMLKLLVLICIAIAQWVQPFSGSSVLGSNWFFEQWQSVHGLMPRGRWIVYPSTQSGNQAVLSSESRSLSMYSYSVLTVLFCEMFYLFSLNIYCKTAFLIDLDVQNLLRTVLKCLIW